MKATRVLPAKQRMQPPRTFSHDLAFVGDNECSAGQGQQMHTGQRAARVTPHVLGLLIMVVAALALGRPEGWIGVFAPVGPLVAAGTARLAGRTLPGWRDALGFALIAGPMIVVGWAIMRAPEVFWLTAVLFPLGLLLFLLGVVNYVTVSLSRALRAARGQTLDYPWVPDRLHQALHTSAIPVQPT